MGVFEWHNGKVPKNLEIKQVYAIAFSHDGRILLRIEDYDGRKSYSLAGGKPEKFDVDQEATVRREFLEEVNTELEKDIFLVGYQTVNEPSGIPPYAQVRMAAIIKKIGKKQPDPDGGKIYDRLLTTPERAIELLNWDDGEQMIRAAVRVAKTKLGIKTFSTVEEYV